MTCGQTCKVPVYTANVAGADITGKILTPWVPITRVGILGSFHCDIEPDPESEPVEIYKVVCDDGSEAVLPYRVMLAPKTTFRFKGGVRPTE